MQICVNPKHLRLLLGLTIVLSLAVLSEAGSVPIGGPWQEYSFQAAGAPVMGCQPADPNGLFCIPSSGGNSVFAGAPAWTFVAPMGGTVLIVTDAFTTGDIFQVLDFGKMIGTTSTVVPSPYNCGSDPVPCSMDVRMSNGQFLLTGGDHSITIIDTTDPYGAGAAYFHVGPLNVAEPSTIALVLGGPALAFVGRRISSKRWVPHPTFSWLGGIHIRHSAPLCHPERSFGRAEGEAQSKDPYKRR
jgi:hypothetical protein